MDRRRFLKYLTLVSAATLLPLSGPVFGAASDRRAARGDDIRAPMGPVSSGRDSIADQRYIFLTIDDGPTDLMADILDILKKTSCKATFFCIGSLLETEPGKALAARALGEGHRIGNHSYTFPHFSFPTLSYEKAVDEIDRTHDIIGGILSEAGTDYTRHGKYFRFPFGYSGGKKVVTYLHGLGYTIYRWNINSFDWKCERHTATLSWVEKRCLSAKDGDIILCHDHGMVGIARQIIPAVVDYYRPRDFVFETLAKYKAVGEEEGLKTKNVVF